MKLLNLTKGARYWSVTFQDENVTTTGPTYFPSTIAREDVLARIEHESPGIEITDKARGKP